VQRGQGPAPASAALAYVTVWQPTAATWWSLMQHLTSVVLLDGGPTPRWASSLLEMTRSGHGRCLAVLLHILVLVTAVLMPGIDVIGKGRINAGKAE
jgi:hypothetical protein